MERGSEGVGGGPSTRRFHVGRPGHEEGGIG